MKVRDILPLINKGDDILISKGELGAVVILADFITETILSDNYLDSKVDGIEVDASRENRIIIYI